MNFETFNFVDGGISVIDLLDNLESRYNTNECTVRIEYDVIDKYFGTSRTMSCDLRGATDKMLRAMVKKIKLSFFKDGKLASVNMVII